VLIYTNPTALEETECVPGRLIASTNAANVAVKMKYPHCCYCRLPSCEWKALFKVHRLLHQLNTQSWLIRLLKARVRQVSVKCAIFR